MLLVDMLIFVSLGGANYPKSHISLETLINISSYARYSGELVFVSEGQGLWRFVTDTELVWIVIVSSYIYLSYSTLKYEYLSTMDFPQQQAISRDFSAMAGDERRIR